MSRPAAWPTRNLKAPWSVVTGGLAGASFGQPAAWQRAASWAASPVVTYPAALAATAWASVLASRGCVMSCVALLAIGAAAWCLGYYYSRELARTAALERQLSSLHLATIEALASAIDAKDRTSAVHVRRVQSLARALARRIGLDDEQVQAIGTAALLHDVGKLAVPEHILSKPGPLTDEEFDRVKIHAQVGFEIIEHVPFPSPVAPLVLCHHEHWNGTGYPLGLRGDDIPIGARVLAVADHFEAVMRDRPYNRALSREAAALALQEEAGRALDPHLVSVFLDLLDTLTDDELSAAGSRDEREPAGRRQQGLARGKAALENIARAHEEIYSLYEIAQAIGSSLGVAETMSIIAGKLSALVPFSACALFVNEEDGAVACRFASGAGAEQIEPLVLEPGGGLAGWAIRNRRPIVNGRPAADLAAGGAPAHTDLRSALVSPLVSGGRAVGALALYHTEPRFYTDEHRRLLDQLSDQMAAAISNSIVFERTREESLRDVLTGLPNTRYIFNHLARELARARRTGAEVGLLVIDLDEFKQVNDTFGHQAGDRALRAVARVLHETVRHYDVCARYAGDEFIIVLPGCGKEETEAKRVELQEAVRRIRLDVAPDRTVQVSMSAGAAVYPADGDTYEALLAAADSHMYRDKRTRKPAADAAAVVPAEAAFPPAPTTVLLPAGVASPVN